MKFEFRCKRHNKVLVGNAQDIPFFIPALGSDYKAWEIDLSDMWCDLCNEDDESVEMVINILDL